MDKKNLLTTAHYFCVMKVYKHAETLYDFQPIQVLMSLFHSWKKKKNHVLIADAFHKKRYQLL